MAAAQVMYWMPRSALMAILAAAAARPPYADAITVLPATRLEALRAEPGGRLAVDATRLLPGGGGGQRLTLRPQLVLGCDGLNSSVGRVPGWECAAWHCTALPA